MLVISACVLRKSHSLEAVGWRDEVSSQMAEKKRNLYFADLNHSQKVLAAQVLSTKPIRATSVLAAKRPVPPGLYQEKNQLYFYMTRYLLERVFWLCRDMRPRVPEGDGRVAITFSRRGGMSYEAFRDYLSRLRETNNDDVTIHWPVIDIDAVDAQDHSRLASLQLTDAIASSFAAAVEPDRYGNCEPRYAELLKPITYNRRGNYLSYGVKLVPRHENCNLTAQQQGVIRLFG